jgi:metal-responsive CopG/Arc/MetJ family transcriptional regulator
MKRTQVFLPEQMLDKLNKISQQKGISKGEIIRRAIENYLEEDGNMKIYYEDILVGEVLTNRSLHVDEALNLIGFNEQEFIEENGFDDIDYNEFRMEY